MGHIHLVLELIKFTFPNLVNLTFELHNENMIRINDGTIEINKEEVVRLILVIYTFIGKRQKF